MKNNYPKRGIGLDSLYSITMSATFTFCRASKYAYYSFNHYLHKQGSANQWFIKSIEIQFPFGLLLYLSRQKIRS